MDSLIPFTTSGSLVDCVDSTSTPSQIQHQLPTWIHHDSPFPWLGSFHFSRPGLGKMLVVLRDGRKLHGVLRSYDQFGEHLCLYSLRRGLSIAISANLVLEDTVERIYHGNAFAENWHGLFLIRGENVVLLGEIVSSHHYAWCNTCSYAVSRKDLDQEDEIPLQQVDYNVLEAYHKNDTAVKKRREDIKAQILYEQKGFCKEGGEGDGYWPQYSVKSPTGRRGEVCPTYYMGDFWQIHYISALRTMYLSSKFVQWIPCKPRDSIRTAISYRVYKR